VIIPLTVAPPAAYAGFAISENRKEDECEDKADYNVHGVVHRPRSQFLTPSQQLDWQAPNSPPWEGLFAPPEVDLGILSRMYFTPQTHDLIGGRCGLGPFFHEVIFKLFRVKLGLLKMMGG